MNKSRLSLAVNDGLIALPATGTIAVFRGRAGDDLSALPKDRTEVIQGFKPDSDGLSAQGYGVSAVANGPYAASLVMVPRSKPETQALIAEAAALTPGGLVLVDGQKTDGIDSLLKVCRQKTELGGGFSKAHGKMFWFTGGAGFEDWRFDGTAQEIAPGFRTVPGVFSADRIDRGSLALAAALPEKLPARIADLGAGWGYLSAAILARKGVESLDLIEAEQAALDCARLNITDARAGFHWADATTFVPDGLYDGVVSNPPFHTSRAADPAIGQAFLAAAARILTPSGKLWLVANRHLPYERGLADLFRNVTEIAGDRSFKILHATAPKRASRLRA